jgi:hypothetical protein
MGGCNAVLCACIDHASIGVVEKWGRFLRLATPGFHFFNPLKGECLAGVLSTRLDSLEVCVETKTKVLSLSLSLQTGTEFYVDEEAWIIETPLIT